MNLFWPSSSLCRPTFYCKVSNSWGPQHLKWGVGVEGGRGVLMIFTCSWELSWITIGRSSTWTRRKRSKSVSGSPLSTHVWSCTEHSYGGRVSYRGITQPTLSINTDSFHISITSPSENRCSDDRPLVNGGERTAMHRLPRQTPLHNVTP